MPAAACQHRRWLVQHGAQWQNNFARGNVIYGHHRPRRKRETCKLRHTLRCCCKLGFDFAIDALERVFLFEVNSHPAIASGSMEHVQKSRYSALVQQLFDIIVLPPGARYWGKVGAAAVTRVRSRRRPVLDVVQLHEHHQYSNHTRFTNSCVNPCAHGDINLPWWFVDGETRAQCWMFASRQGYTRHI